MNLMSTSLQIDKMAAEKVEMAHSRIFCQKQDKVRSQ